MLLELFPSLKSNRFIQIVNKFLYSKYYIILIGLACFLCNVFAFEIPLFYSFVFTATIVPSLICEDFLPIIAPLSMTYSSISLKSNNTRYNTSLFGGNNFIHLFILIGLIVISVLPRLIFDLLKKPERRKKPALFLGYIFLGPCFVLGGLCTPYWEQKTILYGLVCFLSISGCYFILLYAIDWEKVKKDYFFWTMTVYGLSITLEVIYMYIAIKNGNNDFISYLGHMFTGWGMRNNIAGQICLCVAAPIYLTLKSKKISWLYLSLSILMIGGCALTLSRGGLLTAILVFIAGIIICFLRSTKQQKIAVLSVLGVSLSLLVVICILKRDELSEYFNRLIEINFDSLDTYEFTQGRDRTWMHGFEHYLENELFGVGFYQCTDFQFWNFSTGFVPPRYHNIYIQFLASTGLIGLGAYFYHRAQTLIITFRKPTIEKTMIYMTIAALVFSSLFDNHFFNMGPGLNYCVALAFIEGLNIQEESRNLSS